MSELNFHEGVAEAAEHSKERKGARWTPIAAAAVAVLAAMTNLLSAHRSTQALIAKNETVAALTRASDSYNYYEAKSIKEELYRSAIIVQGRKIPALQQVVDHEHATKKPVLEKARAFEHQAEESDARSERYLRSFETLETGVTFLQVAIVVLSISALVGTLALPIIAAVATAVGIGFAVAGVPV